GTVSRMPQTTGQPAAPGSTPFTRVSRQGQILGTSAAGQAYGSLWTPTLKPVGGYLRHMILTVTSVTGGALTSAVATADAQCNPQATVFGTFTGTAPTITSAVNEPFWMAPVDQPQIAPPDVGSSAQWSEARAAAGVASAQFQRIQLPRVGTFIHTLILVLRD